LASGDRPAAGGSFRAEDVADIDTEADEQAVCFDGRTRRDERNRGD
jgi:hypothetical protein